MIEKVERDIFLIYSWLDENRLEVNASKTDYILLGALQT
jgi:hypothetical protein